MNEEHYHEVPEDFSIQQFRPRFEAHLSLTPRVIADRFKSALAIDGCGIRGHVSEQYVTLFFPKERQKYWTPILTLTVQDTESGSKVRGMYSPQPSIWTLFVFFYTVVGTLAVFSLILGGVQSTLEKSPWGLWLSLLLIGILGTMFLVSQYGKKISRPQMVILHEFLIGKILNPSKHPI